MSKRLFKHAELAVLLWLAGTTPALAAHPDSNTELDNLRQRIEVLETGRAEKPDEEGPFSLFAGNSRLTFGGTLELQASYTAPEQGEASSDLSLATAALATEVTVSAALDGHLVLLYEEEPGEDALQVDEAVIALHSPRPLLGQTLSFYGGRLYLPFGRFNSFMVSDPLTLELGETSDTAALFALEGPLWNLRLGVFNGGTDAQGDADRIDSLVAALEVTALENLSCGVSWISDLATSDSALVTDPARYRDPVPGASAFLSARFATLALEAEILGALEDFDPALVDLSDLTGRRPRAWNLEVAWMPTDDLQLAARCEQARTFRENPRRWGVAASWAPLPHTLLALEYLHALPAADSVTAQLALDF